MVSIKVLDGSHGPGLGELAFVTFEGAEYLITSGSNGEVIVRDWKEDSARGTHEDSESVPVTCVAIHPQGHTFATGADDGCVRLYSLQEDGTAEFNTYATRFSNPPPVRALSFSSDGALLACGGDEGIIRVVELEGNTVKASLGEASAIMGSVVSLAFDPQGTYIAAIHQEGTLQVWDWARGKVAFSKRRACPKSVLQPPAEAHVARASWTSDDGTFLMAPASDGTLIMYPRLEWAPSQGDTFEFAALKGPLTAVVPSPNGLYIAAADRAGAVAILDTRISKIAAHIPAAEGKTAAVSLAWRTMSGSSELAVLRADGSVSVWEACIPEGMQGPLEPVQEDDGAPQSQANQGEGGADAGGEGSVGEDGGAGDGSQRHLKGGKAAKPARRAPLTMEDFPPEILAQILYRTPEPQAAVQQGSTLENPINRRRFLAYNFQGCIASKAESDYTTIEASFHDTAKHPVRLPMMRDVRGISLAAMGDRGAIYAAPPRGRGEDAHPGFVMFQPFESWAPGTAWELPFSKDEEAVCLAAGRTFVAAATTLGGGFLRIFTLGGVQTSMLDLPGSPVALAAQGTRLAVLYHRGSPLADGTQVLGYMLLDCYDRRKLQSGEVTLSRGSGLFWAGFSEAGLLATCDTQGVVRALTQDFAGEWLRVFDFDAERKGQEGYWIFGLSEDRVYCVVTPRIGEDPQVVPRPAHETYPLRAPVLLGADRASVYEENLVRHQLHLSDRVWAESQGLAVDVPAPRDSKHWRLESDKTALRLFNEDCKKDKLQRALELASQLHDTNLLEKALVLANHQNKVGLAERLTQLIEGRRQVEDQAAEADVDTPERPMAAQPEPVRAVPATKAPTAAAPNAFKRPAAAALTSGAPANKFARR